MTKKTYHVINEEKEYLKMEEVFNKDNKQLSLKSFDQSGNCLESIDTDYDEAGRTKETRIIDESGSITQKMTYSYESDGDTKIIREKTFYLDNSFDETVSYFKDEAIQKVEHIQDGSATKIENYRYDGNGRIAEYIELDEGNNETAMQKYEYSDNARKIIVFEEGEISETIDQTFNSDGLLISQTSDNGTYKSTTERTYDAKGNLVNEKHLSGSIMLQDQNRKYDSNNNCIEIETERFNTNRRAHKDIEKTIHEYDSNNRLIYSFDISGGYRYIYE